MAEYEESQLNALSALGAEKEKSKQLADEVSKPSTLNPEPLTLYLNNTTRSPCDAAWGDPAPECFLCWKRLVRLAGQTAELQNETERDL